MTAIAIALEILGTRFPGLGFWKLILLWLTVTLEVVIALGVLPLWLISIGDTLAPRLSRWLKKHIVKTAHVPARALATFDDKEGFLLLGAVFFLVGTTMQFIAGA